MPSGASRLQHRAIDWPLRALGFLLVFGALQQAWEAGRDGPIEYRVIHDAVVRPAAAAVNLLTPGVQASAVGFTLHAAGGGINVLNGCEGTELLLLVVAALLVAPMRMRARLQATLLALPVTYLLTEARLLGLFYAQRTDRALFATLHGSVTPMLLVVAMAAYVHLWVEHDRRQAAARH
jgi:exosortase/archaeosortase family protein